jgi:signal transduction histidine kinase/ligand-binding sensor domain-containing protein
MFSLLRPSFAVCLFAAVLCASTDLGRGETAPAQSIPVTEDYVLRKWELDDGLPNNHVSSLAQTPDGYLWVAMGAGGLARFDGIRFVPVTSEANPGLESDHASELYVARDGALWIGMERGGIARCQGGRFETVVPMGPVKGQAYFPSGFAEDAEGGIWFPDSVARRCFRWSEGKLTTFPWVVNDRAQVHADSAGKIWCESPWGYDVFEGGKIKSIDRINRVSSHMTPAKEGGMWVFREQTPENRQVLFRFQADGTKEFVADLNAVGGLRASEVNTMSADRFGALWIGTRSHGLLKFDKGRLVRVPTGHSCILKLMEDREGSLWVGTEGGLNRLCRSGFSLRQTRHGLSNDSVVSLTQDTQGRIWLLCRYGRPFRASDSANRFFEAAPELGEGSVMTLCSDPSGRVWFGALNGVGFWRENAVVRLPGKNSYTALLADRNEGIWAASIQGGLSYLKDGQAESIPTENGLVLPRALAQDQSGGVWVGTEEGLVFHHPPPGQGKEPSAGSRFSPVPLPGAQHRAQIRFIAPDPSDGSVWIGAFGDGLFRWKSGRVTRLSPESGLPLADLRALLICGDFWIGTGRGLYRIERQALVEAMEGKPGPMPFISYGRNDGLPSMEFSYGFRNATAQTPDGHLWFATYSGALEVNPQLLAHLSPPGSVLIESLEFGGTSIAASEGLARRVLPPNPGPVQVRFTLPELRAPDQLHFRYRLIGSSDSWISLEGQRVAVFEHLAPGNYRFEVSAADTGGAWRQPSALEFSVQAAWWETLGFRMSLALLATVGVGVSVRFIFNRRIRARLRRLEQEHALERERARIARDMHDDLGASLTQISLSSELVEMLPPESAAPHIKEMAELARRTVRSLGEIVWAVNPRNDNLPALLEHLEQYAHDCLGSAGIHCQVELPECPPLVSVPSHVRHHLFLAVKEALTNILRHSRAHAAQLNVQTQGDHLRIVISDDGCGFEVGPQKMGSDGLVNFGVRMKEIQGSVRVESSPGKGTSIIFELPISTDGG